MLLLTLAQPAWCAPFCTSRAGAASRLGPADSQHASWARPGEAPAEGRGSEPTNEFSTAPGSSLDASEGSARLTPGPAAHEAREQQISEVKRLAISPCATGPGSVGLWLGQAGTAVPGAVLSRACQSPCSGALEIFQSYLRR
ncbi:unnamed protein product [Arctogadus glacialis]